MTAAPPACVRLGAELSALRERAGLTLGELAARTPYSRSTWHRYLNARALPPWPAVLCLADLAGEPEPRLRALWELADRAWSGRTRTAPAQTSAQPPPAQTPVQPPPAVAVRPEPVATSGPEPLPVPASAPAGRGRFRGAVTILTTAVVCGGLAATFAAQPWSRPEFRHAPAGFHVACTGVACNGLDPQATSCGVEPDTLLHRQVRAGFGLDIRYNPMCRAAWARVWNLSPGGRLTFSVAGQPVQSVTDTRARDLDPFLYTPLAAVTGSHLTLRACVTEQGNPAPVCYTTLFP